MSVSLTTEMGLAGMQVDGVECVNGDILPIYSVDRVNLAVNGRTSPQPGDTGLRFLSVSEEGFARTGHPVVP